MASESIDTYPRRALTWGDRATLFAIAFVVAAVVFLLVRSMILGNRSVGQELIQRSDAQTLIVVDNNVMIRGVWYRLGQPIAPPGVRLPHAVRSVPDVDEADVTLPPPLSSTRP